MADLHTSPRPSCSRSTAQARAVAGRGDARRAATTSRAGSRTCTRPTRSTPKPRSPRRAPREARWLRGRSRVGPLDGVPAMIKENIATARRAGAARHRGDRARAGAARRAAGGAPARGRRGDPRQDDDARLRHAVVGPVELPRADAQPVGPEPRTRAAAAPAPAPAAAAGYGPLHVGTDIGGSVRLPAGWCGIFTPEAEPRPDPDRPAVRRPRRRADDAHASTTRRC